MSDAAFKWVTLAALVFLGYQYLVKPVPGPVPPSNTWRSYIDAANLQPEDRGKLGAIMAGLADAIVRDGSLTIGGEAVEPRIATTADLGDLLAIVVRYENLQNYQLDPLVLQMSRTINPGEEARQLDAPARMQIATLLDGVAVACQ